MSRGAGGSRASPAHHYSAWSYQPPGRPLPSACRWPTLFHQGPNVKAPRPLPASRFKVQAITRASIYLSSVLGDAMAERDFFFPPRGADAEAQPIACFPPHCWHFIPDIIFGILIRDRSPVYDSLISSSHPSCGRQPVSRPVWGGRLPRMAKSLRRAAGGPQRISRRACLPSQEVWFIFIRPARCFE